jgi:hypothetical protein
VIARAVSRLDNNNLETRQTLYNHARAALAGQLNGRRDSPIPESQIARERIALESAICRRGRSSDNLIAFGSRRPTLDLALLDPLFVALFATSAMPAECYLPATTGLLKPSLPSLPSFRHYLFWTLVACLCG